MRLVDTSVVVDIDRGGVEDRVAALDDEGRHALSVVSVTELRLGVSKRYDRDSDAHGDAMIGLDRLIARFDVLAVTRSAAAVAADIIDDLTRTGEPLHDLHDVYIAATARVNELPVLTANVSHFDRIEDVRVDDWGDF